MLSLSLHALRRGLLLSMILGLRFLLGCLANVLMQQLSLFAIDVPVLNKAFDQCDQQVGLLWVHVDDHIDIFLHMGPDVADLA